MATKLGDMAVGSVVKVPEGGALVDYLVVQQGRPYAIYDPSCVGTWLLRREIFSNRQWHSSNVNDYANSDIMAYLDGTFLARFESSIQATMRRAKVPYRPGSGTGTGVNKDADGLPCRIFLLSGSEIGWRKNVNQYFPEDGVTLSYFEGAAAVDAKRIAYLNGSAAAWWLRSPVTNGSEGAWCVNADGDHYMVSCSSSFGVRPAFILPPEMVVTSSGQVTQDPAGLYLKKSGAWVRS